ncbi:MAG: hypothetical protein M1817_003666 [Caeruleum heppii]|nr:MAG: hypothetical protein M1817_003666 [Caeruleum heppii]
MFCLRSWLPLLFIPTNASPFFIILFFTSTYFLNRPCVYCSLLLLILFISSCYWSDRCFFDLSHNPFEPRHLSSPLPNPIPAAVDESPAMANATMMEASFLADAISGTARVLGGALGDTVKRRLMDGRPEWTGIGVQWIRSMLGRREWRVPCVDVMIRL